MPRYPLLADILESRERLNGIALRTPLEASPILAAESGAAEVRLKLEMLQPTGSFKTRGAHQQGRAHRGAAAGRGARDGQQRQSRDRGGHRGGAAMGCD